MVFRKYLTFLIREGYTQEFFIEGGRAAPARSCTPKLGMLSAIVNAFVRACGATSTSCRSRSTTAASPRRRRTGASSSGEEKERESLGALLRARSVLSRRYGTVYVSFAEPISLARGARRARERFRAAAGRAGDRGGEAALHPAARLPPAARGERRRGGGRDVGQRHGAARRAAARVPARASSCIAARTLIELLRVQARARSPRRSCATRRRTSARASRWLESGGLVERIDDSDGVVLHVPPEKRHEPRLLQEQHHPLLPRARAGDARAARRRAARASCASDVAWWLDLYRWEFPLPERETLARRRRRAGSPTTASGRRGRRPADRDASASSA